MQVTPVSAVLQWRPVAGNTSPVSPSILLLQKLRRDLSHIFALSGAFAYNVTYSSQNQTEKLQTITTKVKLTDLVPAIDYFVDVIAVSTTGRPLAESSTIPVTTGECCFLFAVIKQTLQLN